MSGPVGAFVWERADRAEVLEQLRSAHPELGFADYPGAGGFRVKGTRANLLRLLQQLPPGVHPAISLKFRRISRAHALAEIAGAANLELFCHGPELTGEVGLNMRWAKLSDALREVMPEERTFRIVPDRGALVVAHPWRMHEAVEAARRVPLILDGARQEFILEDQPAGPVVDFLAARYPAVKFVPHPTMNGFYAIGSKKDILSIRSELPRVPPPPEPSQREILAVKHVAVRQARDLLMVLVPDLHCEVDERLNCVIVEGTPSAIEQARALLTELDRPVEAR